MSKKEFNVELKQEDYQGYHKNGEKIIGRNHLLLIANGYIGIRGCLNEIFKDKEDSSIHCIGIYDQVGYDDPDKDIWKEIINFPNFLFSEMTFDNEKVYLKEDKSNVSDFKIHLNMRNATLYLQYIWKSKKGNRLQVNLERFCAYHNKNLVFNKVEITSLDTDGTLDYKTGIIGKVYDANGVHLTDFNTKEYDDRYILVTRTRQHKYQIAISSKHKLIAEYDSEINKSDKDIYQSFNIKLQKGEKAEITSQHLIFTSRDSMDPVANSLTASYDYSKEKQKHDKELEKHWLEADVEIEVDNEYIENNLRDEIKLDIQEKIKREIKFGLIKDEEKSKKISDELEKEIFRIKNSGYYLRYCLYITLISIPKDFDYASIPSRSLSYATYKGAIFWEIDTYAFPFYAHVYPEYARNLLLYRFKGLEYAIKKAADLGFDGAFFAWESLDTGEEATKEFVWQDIHSGRMMRNYFGDRQWHIAGDVIYALWMYYEISGDWEFIENYGSYMTFLTARFVGSLVYYKPVKDRYEILHTCCPDEYHEEVDNNIFTNRVLRFVLEKAVELALLMEENVPEKFQKIKLRYKISDEELEYWEDIINKLYVKEPYSENKVLEQHDGYFKLEDISLEEFKSRIIKDEYLGYPNGPAVYTQIIKQADTIQMLVMFKNEYHPIVRLATFDYYDLRTEHGSGDSPNAYGIVAAQVGRVDRALWYFLRSARIDLESTNPARKANFQLGGVHIASSGATWQVIHYGFAGFELEGDILKFNPILPKGWRKLKYSFLYKGQKINVIIDRENITIRSSDNNELELNIIVNDQKVFLLSPSKEMISEYKKMGNHYYTYNDVNIGINNKRSRDSK